MVNMEKTITVDVKSDLQVIFNAENMGLSIEGGDAEICEVHIKIKGDGSIEEEELNSIVQVDYKEEENEISINCEEPHGLRHAKYSVKVTVPKVCEVRANTENGPVSLKNLHGIQEVHSENGPCKFTDIDGDIVVQIENGPISIMNCISEVELTSENGPIKIVELSGDAVIKSENGPVKISKCSGKIGVTTENGMIRMLDCDYDSANIATENGSIYYEFLPIDVGNFRFKSENGRITLVIPEEVQIDLIAKNQLGKVHMGLSGHYENRTEEEYKIFEMVKGSGKVDIKVENEHGSIRLIPNKQEFKEFDISFVGDILEGALPSISKEKMDKVKKKLDKVKIKMENLNLPDMSKLPDIEKIVEKVESEMKKAMGKVSNEEFIKEKAAQIKVEISDVVGKVHKKMVEKELSPKEKSEVDERSRIKILELLEKGIINAEEAERLINAMEGKDA